MRAIVGDAGRRVDVGGREAESMLARVGGCEGEFAIGPAALGDNTVVVVEQLVDGDVDALQKYCCEKLSKRALCEEAGHTMSLLCSYCRELWLYCVALKWPVRTY